MTQRQQVLVLYLSDSALDSGVIAWAMYDGAAPGAPVPGDLDEAPYKSGLAALQDGWRLIQASQLIDHGKGEEYRTGYLRYEFFFEKLVNIDA